MKHISFSCSKEFYDEFIDYMIVTNRHKKADLNNFIIRAIREAIKNESFSRIIQK